MPAIADVADYRGFADIAVMPAIADVADYWDFADIAAMPAIADVAPVLVIGASGWHYQKVPKNDGGSWYYTI